MIEIISMIALLLVTELVTGKLAFMPNVKSIKDGHGRVRAMCKGACGGFGDAWGSLGGYCTSCKHDADVGCKCTLHDCGKKYWAKTQSEKREANARGRDQPTPYGVEA
tara:strand:+ start:1632 stop:1955 length:324 start_codon:yes stop_codon:yes gene_type:complete